MAGSRKQPALDDPERGWTMGLALLAAVVALLGLAAILARTLARRRRSAAETRMAPPPLHPEAESPPEKIGAYRIHQRLRQEGVAVTYAATDLDGKRVLLKVLPPDALQLTDFALARLQFMPSLAATTTALGEPQMMAPEGLTRGQDALDARSDLYTVGVLMYRVLSGFYPFDNANPEVLLRAICEGRVRPLAELRQDVPLDLSRVVLRLLDRTPEKRYQRAAELVRALREVASSLAPT